MPCCLHFTSLAVADNPSSLDTMKLGLPGKVVSAATFSEKKAVGHTRLTPVDDAVVDMWTASFAAEFKGTAHSSYTNQIAAFRKARGGAPLEGRC